MGSLLHLSRRDALTYLGCALGGGLTTYGALATTSAETVAPPSQAVCLPALHDSRSGYRPTKIPQAFRGSFDPQDVEWVTECRYRWDRKRRFGNPTADAVGETLVDELARGCDPKRISLAEYVRVADDVICDLHGQLAWYQLPHLYRGLSDERVPLVRSVASHIDGRALLAYALTEIRASSTDGALNRDYVDFLLQYGGREFIERIPAGSDRFTSYGPYQFTQWALYAHHRKRRGASIVNEALHESERIPGSVGLLRGDDHFKAAYLFAVHNVVCLVTRLADRECATLAQVLPGRTLARTGTLSRLRTASAQAQAPATPALAEFIGAAHHLPLAAYVAGERWLRQKAVGSFVSCIAHDRVRRYATITAANYAAL